MSKAQTTSMRSASCLHEDYWSDGVMRYCADCGLGELVDPDYDEEL